jgi:hypothetical protein
LQLTNGPVHAPFPENACLYLRTIPIACLEINSSLLSAGTLHPCYAVCPHKRLCAASPVDFFRVQCLAAHASGRLARSRKHVVEDLHRRQRAQSAQDWLVSSQDTTASVFCTRYTLRSSAGSSRSASSGA